MVRLLRYLAIAVLLALIVTGLLYWKGTRLAPLPPATVDFAALAAPDRAALVARGAEVARDADCVACHLDPEGGSELGGGYPMHLPMGTLYGTNISPSREHGIGEWSADDLYRAVVWGVAPGGRNLYPAMPYVSYHAITRADSDALYAWLMAQRPVEKPSRRPDLMFPFNVRPALSLWNALFRPDAQPFAPAEGEAPDRARGRYLVDVLGHCGECHTPRNLAFAMTEPALGGQVLEGAYAPDLQQNSMVRRGWNPDDLIAFLHRGVSPQGVPTLTMLPVLQHSTSHMDDASLTAISTYLLGGQGRRAAGGGLARSGGAAALPRPVRGLPRDQRPGAAPLVGAASDQHHRHDGRPAEPGPGYPRRDRPAGACPRRADAAHARLRRAAERPAAGRVGELPAPAVGRPVGGADGCGYAEADQGGAGALTRLWVRGMAL